MKKFQSPAEQKLAMLFQHAPTGLVEIDRTGKIIWINNKGELLLKPVFISYDIGADNLFPLLEQIAPQVAQIIICSSDDEGQVLSNALYCFTLPFGGENIERHFNVSITKIYTDCIIVGFDDCTQKSLEERAIIRLRADKDVMQGKFEIATNILHDIGNAVVGLGSYISRIKRSVENNNTKNLEKLTDFFTANETAMGAGLGEIQAGATVKMLTGITKTQKNGLEEISKSVTEQLQIITHIQDILNIQRNYVNGQESQEKKPVNLRTIITDCMSMLFASIEKRGIKISVNIPQSLPVINGDRTCLMQVILNLLKNSIEAIDVNASEKNISLAVSKHAGQLVFETQDTGHGFDEATGKQLFKRGFTTKVSGSGIGLDSCKEIIERHEGTIDITSEGYGKGTVTTVRFKI